MKFCFDIDGTLCSNTHGAYERAEPWPAMIAQVNALHDAGHRILLFTARGSTTGIDWRGLTEKQMADWGVRYHELRLGKPEADIFIDDRAVSLDEWAARPPQAVRDLLAAARTALPAIPVPAIGIMQGRLLPPFEGRFQAFPARGWADEFAKARDAGLACIEWIYEAPHEGENPLSTDAGAAELATRGRDGVGVRSVCADYYITHRLVGTDGTVHRGHLDHLKALIGRAGRLGAAYIVLPFVDGSALASATEWRGLIEAAKVVASAAADAGIELHLETSLPPRLFAAILERIGHPAIKANFDIGNSAALGFAPDDELGHIGPWLGSVHVKDRDLGGGTVPLGTGDADFAACFRQFARLGFGRWFILQAARGEPGGEVELARANVAFVRRHWATAVGA